jgi:hypothetical protein
VGRAWERGFAMTNPGGGPLKPSKRASAGAARSWGPYWDILFPPAMVTEWINWKRMSSGVNVARRLWDQREYLRRTYESVHGDDPAAWPSQHPGVVLDAVLWMAHPACLRCHWFDAGFYMRREGGVLRALDLARAATKCPTGQTTVEPSDALRTRLNPLWKAMIRDPPL